MVLERRLKCREKLRAEKQVLLWQSHNAKVSTLRWNLPHRIVTCWTPNISRKRRPLRHCGFWCSINNWIQGKQNNRWSLGPCILVNNICDASMDLPTINSWEQGLCSKPEIYGAGRGRLSGTGASWDLRIGHLFLQKSLQTDLEYSSMYRIVWHLSNGGLAVEATHLYPRPGAGLFAKAVVCPVGWVVIVYRASCWQSLEEKSSLKALCLPWPQCASVGQESWTAGPHAVLVLSTSLTMSSKWKTILNPCNQFPQGPELVPLGLGVRDSEIPGTSCTWRWSLGLLLLGIHGAGPSATGLQGAGQKYIATGDAVTIFILCLHMNLLLCHPRFFSVLHLPFSQVRKWCEFLRLIICMASSTYRRMAHGTTPQRGSP